MRAITGLLRMARVRTLQSEAQLNMIDELVHLPAHSSVQQFTKCEKNTETRK